ncbi:MAG: hypothetical protein COW84_03085 [Gammaproteobacteria bacterium CG22_combo_CG10-13_8_21_14_all_40_8]|nr:MAG: hypothetical protein COW84_03085 [Gammaproteobacteria bacterium CG22_combo_CG10-13_8_21_14_all_40_8]
MNTKTLVSLAFASLLSSTALMAQEHSTVNSDIEVHSGEGAQDVSSVNGDILVHDNAEVGSIATVNGDINIQSGATLGSISTVNGDIDLDTNVSISKDIGSVNGDMHFKSGSKIQGDITSVNGDLDLDNVNVQGHITVVTSDIEIKNGTHIEGGLRVKKSKHQGWFLTMLNFSKDNKPKIIIGDNVVINGPVVFEREVDLTMAKSAKVATIDYAYKK